MTVSKTSNQKKKVSVSLSEREANLLQFYATQKGIRKSVAAKRLINEGLHQYAAAMDKSAIPVNQLGLFDGVQTDIFCLDELK